MSSPTEPNSKEENNRFRKEKSRLQRTIKKKIKRIQKGLLEKEIALKNSKKYQEFEHIADVLKSHFHLLRPHMETITLLDWNQENRSITIQLDPTLTPEEQIKNAYKRAKKLRRAQEPLTEQ
jgi:predicted ribosome quality control (RQC) complex YloA/Tae2 family protein